MTAAEHHHHWVVVSIDGNSGGKDARMVTVGCTGCSATVKKLTARSDVEIQAELDAANE